MKDYRGLLLPAPPKPERKASGHIIMDDGNGPRVTADTLQCCHGGEHFISIKGSGTMRAFCLRCSGVTCGRPEHAPCIPFEKRLEDFEKGRLVIL